MNLIERLKSISDNEYASFQIKIIPTIKKEQIIGVRVPQLRSFAKKYITEKDSYDFLNTLPHFFYEENILHSILISEMKDTEQIYYNLERFLPFVDNWAVCDILKPYALKKDKKKLLVKIINWVQSDKTYTIRFGIDMLMTFFLDNDFNIDFLNIPLKTKSDDYYVNMACAWFYATALAKQWDSAITFILERKLPVFIHNKTIQKAIESYRITDSKKEYLKTLKIKK